MRQFGFHVDGHECIEVKEGDTFSFGKHTVTFVGAPMAVSYTHLDVYKRQNKFSTALQVIVLPLPDWPNKIKDSPSFIAKDISETKLSVPDRSLMLK